MKSSKWWILALSVFFGCVAPAFAASFLENFTAGGTDIVGYTRTVKVEDSAMDITVEDSNGAATRATVVLGEGDAAIAVDEGGNLVYYQKGVDGGYDNAKNQVLGYMVGARTACVQHGDTAGAASVTGAITYFQQVA